MKYTTMEQLLLTELVGAQVINHGGIKVCLRRSENIPSMGGATFDHVALFVLDGTVVEWIDHLNPWDIKSITSLKGSETNLYGSRGAYGTVLIETK
ncbi:MAG: hypothetical protein AMS26_18640 [Bacteroides sp. SM23_62]|nr:MAG: hypothetical protein AMS26_18640 [Bacteroides sp. SM23_62]